MKITITLLDIKSDGPDYDLAFKIGNIDLKKKIWYQFSGLFLLTENDAYCDDVKVIKANEI